MTTILLIIQIGIAQLEAVFTDTPEGIIATMNLSVKVYKRKYPIIVMEKLGGGDLFDRIINKANKQETFTERDASIIFRSFISALSGLHNDRDMINVDLKTENLVFASTANDSVKIIDFGMAVCLHSRQEHHEDVLLGTVAFLAPETIKHNELYHQTVYSKATDIWQAGCILYILLTGKYPFGHSQEGARVFQRIKEGVFILDIARLKLSSEAKDLLLRMFTPDPNLRISGSQILLHPWVANAISLPSTNLGDEYFARLKDWSSRRKVQRLLDKSELLTRNRKLQSQLFPAYHPTSTTTSTNVSGAPISPTIDPRSVQGKGRSEVNQHGVNMSLLAQSLHLGNPSEVNSDSQSLSLDQQPLVFLTASSDLKRVRRRLSQTQFVITKEGIQVLKACYLNLINLRNINWVSGIDFEGFHIVILEADKKIAHGKLVNLATREVFNIFDWNMDGSVDYLEFLFTLSSFRNDLNWESTSDVARLYYEIFDLYSKNTIPIDVLAYVLNKLETDMLLGHEEDSYDVPMTPNSKNTEKILLAKEMRAMVESMDADGDGQISFEEFETFFEFLAGIRQQSDIHIDI